MPHTPVSPRPFPPGHPGTPQLSPPLSTGRPQGPRGQLPEGEGGDPAASGTEMSRGHQHPQENGGRACHSQPQRPQREGGSCPPAAGDGAQQGHGLAPHRHQNRHQHCGERTLLGLGERGPAPLGWSDGVGWDEQPAQWPASMSSGGGWRHSPAGAVGARAATWKINLIFLTGRCLPAAPTAWCGVLNMAMSRCPCASVPCSGPNHDTACSLYERETPCTRVPMSLSPAGSSAPMRVWAMERFRL